MLEVGGVGCAPDGFERAGEERRTLRDNSPFMSLDPDADRAMAQAVDARRRGRLQRIEAALGRIEDGEYGYCAECGDEIPPKRLAIEPTIERCVDCAAP